MKGDRHGPSVLMNSIRTILLANWDPNGVGDNPRLADEYDVYLLKILACARASRPIEAVFDVLTDIEKETKMPVDEARRRLAAESIGKILGFNI